MSKYGYIYKTTNLVNSKIYIGQRKYTADKRAYNSYLGSGLKLQRAIKKYGRMNFKKEIIDHCSTKEEINEREVYWILFYNSTDDNVGYNISPGGKGGTDPEHLPLDFKERCKTAKLKKTPEERKEINRKGIETRRANFLKMSEQEQKEWLQRNRMKRKGKAPWNKGLKKTKA